MKVELTKFNKRFGIAKMAAKAYVGSDLCCEAELTLVMGRWLEAMLAVSKKWRVITVG
jgi:hypothetical protein